MRLGYAELALAAQVGAAELQCAQRPRVAILSTGDEVVAVDSMPGPFQIRNSNSVSLAAQVRIAGGEPVAAGKCDGPESKIWARRSSAGLKEDVLVLSGGVSMGKYDLVEKVLKAMGAEFYFDAVAIRPGKPAVFRDVPREAGVWVAGESGFDDGDVRIVRGAGDRFVERGGGAAAAVGGSAAGRSA